MADFALLLGRALEQNGIAVANPIQAQLVRYLELIQKWNRVFNLTTITEPREMVYLHLVDSLIISPHLYGERLLDVGTGAGLPGIPLALINPNQQWTLLDKNSKKTRFLTQVCAELGLNNVNIAHGRCEDFQPEHCFDSILSRAFSSIGSFVQVTEHLLKPDGMFIAMKGKYPDDELAAIPSTVHIKDILPITIKGMNVERHVVRLIRG